MLITHLNIFGVNIDICNDFYSLSGLCRAIKKEYAPFSFLGSSEIKTAINVLTSEGRASYKIDGRYVWVSKELAVIFASKVSIPLCIELMKAFESENLVINVPQIYQGRLLSLDEILPCEGWDLQLLKTFFRKTESKKNIRVTITNMSGLDQEIKSLLHIIEMQQY